jgi:hypothetical protein
MESSYRLVRWARERLPRLSIARDACTTDRKSMALRSVSRWARPAAVPGAPTTIACAPCDLGSALTSHARRTPWHKRVTAAQLPFLEQTFSPLDTARPNGHRRAKVVHCSVRNGDFDRGKNSDALNVSFGHTAVRVVRMRPMCGRSIVIVVFMSRKTLLTGNQLPSIAPQMSFAHDLVGMGAVDVTARRWPS